MFRGRITQLPRTFTGTTDSNGIFRTEFIKDLSSGDHDAEVVDLVLVGYYWDPLSMDLEDDTDGNESEGDKVASVRISRHLDFWVGFGSGKGESVK